MTYVLKFVHVVADRLMSTGNKSFMLAVSL